MTKTKSFYLLRYSLFLIQYSIFTCLQAQGQTCDTIPVQRSIAVAARYAATDNLSNVYVITQKNTIEKYDSSGRKVAAYSNNRNGRLFQIDASNPLKILLWYRDFQTLIFLDRSLTELGTLNLSDAGFPSVKTLSAASDGNIWLYDESLFRLLKITPEGSKLYESQNLSLVLGKDAQPSLIRERNQGQQWDLCVLVPGQGICVFSPFAQFADSWVSREGNISDFQSDGPWSVIALQGKNLSWRYNPPLEHSSSGPLSRDYCLPETITVQDSLLLFPNMLIAIQPKQILLLARR